MCKAFYVKNDLVKNEVVKVGELEFTDFVMSLVNVKTAYNEETKDMECGICFDKWNVDEPIDQIVIQDENEVVLNTVSVCPNCAELIFKEEEEMPELDNIQEVEAPEEDILTEEEANQLQDTVQEVIKAGDKRLVEKIYNLLNTNNKEYVDGLLSVLRTSMLKFSSDNVLFNKIRKSMTTLRRKKEEVKEDEKKTNKLVLMLKQVISCACEVCKAIIKATCKSSLAIGVLLAKITTYTAISVGNVAKYGIKETVDTVKSIGAFYKEDLGKTSMVIKIKKDIEQTKKDFNFFDNMVETIDFEN